MGSNQFPTLGNLSRDIWCWCEFRNIFPFASYISSKANIEADRESRHSGTETEWSLSQAAFDTIKINFGTPEVDLFASYTNNKCGRYVSWIRDPGSYAVDAFTLNWHNINFYAFPPFSIILNMIKKIMQDKAVGVVVVPNWKTQPWYPLPKLNSWT